MRRREAGVLRLPLRRAAARRRSERAGALEERRFDRLLRCFAVAVAIRILPPSWFRQHEHQASSARQ